MEHPNKWVAKPDTWTTTTCDSCAVGCSLSIGSVDGRGVIVRPGTGNPVSGDQICVRGRYHYDSLKPRERLGKHLVRRGQIQAPVGFADAVKEAAAALKAAAAKGKVGVLVGGTATNEEAWLTNRIAKEAFGGSADSALGPVIRATKTALEARLGTWRMAADMTRIASAKAIVVVADDLEESHNVISVRVKDSIVRNGGKLIVIGALRSELVDYAEVWLQPAGGEEGQMAGELAQAIAAGSTTGPLAAAVAVLNAAPRDQTIVICAPNPVSPAQAGAMAAGAANVAVALFGNDASNNLVVLPPEVNVNGLFDMGVATAGAADPLAGLSGLLVIRDDPTMRLPGAAEALAKIETIVVIDGVLHETAKQATVVIAEGRAYATAGTYTQGDFRVQRLSGAIQPESEAVVCIDALASLGQQLGLSLPHNADAALGEIAKANPAYQPAYDLIVGEGVRLTVASSGKGTIVPVPSATAATGIRLITGRDLYTASDAASLRHPEAEKLHRYDHIQVSEQDAARLGIANEAEIEINDGTNTIRAKATVTERVPEGAVYVSSLLQGGAVVAFFGSATVPAVRVGALTPA
jgi:predicted molibdopterin-dependent oxidoreductase YjgC